MSYTRYWAIFNRWYMACTLLYIRYTSCTCRLRGIGPYTNGDTWPVHFYTSDIHPVHVVYAVLGHIQPVIHAYTLLYIRHTPCTCRIHGIGPYSTGDTWLVHFYTSDIHPVHVVYAVLGHIHWYIAYTLLYIRHTYMSYTRYCHIQLVIHSLYTFIHQTFTLYMSYTWYWAIFNRWYIACTLLYIRHTPCTCRIRGIGPYSTGDT